jgi:glutamate racemase
MNLLIFDSGLGGLSVSREIVKLLPHANITYLADHAYFPYGKLSEEAVIERVISLFKTLHIDQYDAVVIACNTASTIGLHALRAAFKTPFIGTVPAIKPAAFATKTRYISVLATAGTVKRDYTKHLIEEFATHCKVTLVGALNLADMCEAILKGEAVSDEALRAEIFPAFIENTDVIVLACTHYPLIIERIKAVAPFAVTYIDPAPAIAQRVKAVVANNTLGNAQRQAFTTGEKTLTLFDIFTKEGFVFKL